MKSASNFNRHFEWVILLGALVTVALMNPYVDQGSSLCLFEWLGISFCPGEGLAHSIAFTARGDFYNAINANLLGPISIIIIVGRILTLLRANFKPNH